MFSIGRRFLQAKYVKIEYIKLVKHQTSNLALNSVKNMAVTASFMLNILQDI